MLRWVSSNLLAAWSGRSNTTEPATNSAETTQSTKATRKTRPIVSFFCALFCELPCNWSEAMACCPPLDIGLHDVIVDDRRAHVAEQDREHHPLRVSRVDDTN